MRTLARALAAVVFATVITSCGIENADGEVDDVDTSTGDDGLDVPGAGAGESFDTPHEGDDDGDGSDGGSGGGGDGDDGTCEASDSTCGGEGGELPPPPPPETCDHDQDGDCDHGDCDHDDDGDCDGDDGGGGHIDGACTFTQGYWKNHPDAWPVASLRLGNVTYSSAQLGDILRTPVANDGLMILAHQLIAAKLNVAFGAPDASVADAIAAADALIGDLVIGVDTLHSSITSGLATELDIFNNSKLEDAECN